MNKKQSAELTDDFLGLLLKLFLSLNGFIFYQFYLPAIHLPYWKILT